MFCHDPCGEQNKIINSINSGDNIFLLDTKIRDKNIKNIYQAKEYLLKYNIELRDCGKRPFPIENISFLMHQLKKIEKKDEIKNRPIWKAISS